MNLKKLVLSLGMLQTFDHATCVGFPELQFKKVALGLQLGLEREQNCKL